MFVQSNSQMETMHTKMCVLGLLGLMCMCVQLLEQKGLQQSHLAIQTPSHMELEDTWNLCIFLNLPD